MTALQTGVLALTPKVIGQIRAKIEEGSAFQRVTQFTPLTREGHMLFEMDQTDAFWIKEGEEKPEATPGITSDTMYAEKLVKTVGITEEFKDDYPYIEEKLMREGMGSLARSFDKTVLGSKSGPTNVDTFKYLSTDDGSAGWTAQVANITTAKSLTTATALVGNTVPSHMILNAKGLAAIKGIYNQNDRKTVTITDTTIDGIPYVLINPAVKSDVAWGIVGDFANSAAWGIIPGSIKLKKSTEATIRINGELKSLFLHNMVGYIAEGYFGYKILDKSAFTELSFS